MKLRMCSVVLLLVLTGVTGLVGCKRALQDGVSIGVTDGLSDGIATLISGFVVSLDGGGE